MHVAVLSKHRPDAPMGSQRQIGMFSYPVDGLTWEEFHPGKSFRIDLWDMKSRGFDAVVLIDGSCWGTFTHRGAIPTLFYTQDSTNSEQHYRDRLKQAEQADLVLVDHDKLERFPRSVRFSHCVNDRLFYPREKTADIAFHMATGRISKDRPALREMVREFAAERGYTTRIGKLPPVEYAESMGAARVVINLPQTPTNRPHRVLDAMASGAALLTGVLPEVSGEDFQEGWHYEHFADFEECRWTLDWLLRGNVVSNWAETAKLGYREVMERHTWATRARQLIDLMRDKGLT